MKYTFKCPACGHPVEVEAMDYEEAVNMLMDEGGKHMKEVHPEMQPDPEMEAMVRKDMVKSEGMEDNQ